MRATSKERKIMRSKMPKIGKRQMTVEGNLTERSHFKKLKSDHSDSDLDDCNVDEDEDLYTSLNQ